jgi:hypothetical protein
MEEKRDYREDAETEEQEDGMVEITKDNLGTFSAQCHIGAVAALALQKKGVVTLRVNSEGKVILCP